MLTPSRKRKTVTVLRSIHALPGATLLFVLAVAAGAQDLDDSLDVVASTNRAAEQSQQKIDALSRETQRLLEEYRTLRESADYQESYTRELEQVEAAQQARIDSLNRQIAQARITRQRILPLMRSMADALETFVVLDLPFHQQERLAAVIQLKQRLDRPELSMAARFRLLLEAYRLEQDYGVTVEAWRGPLLVEEEELSVEFLRVGRTALYYQSLDRERSGLWDSNHGDWVELDSRYNRGLSQAMRVARNQSAPQLLELPLLLSGGGE
jgi:septal ring factor EnvC (AmiA/AmiB activator)